MLSKQTAALPTAGYLKCQVLTLLITTNNIGLVSSTGMKILIEDRSNIIAQFKR